MRLLQQVIIWKKLKEFGMSIRINLSYTSNLEFPPFLEDFLFVFSGFSIYSCHDARSGTRHTHDGAEYIPHRSSRNRKDVPYKSVHQALSRTRNRHRYYSFYGYCCDAYRWDDDTLMEWTRDTGYSYGWWYRWHREPRIPREAICQDFCSHHRWSIHALGEFSRESR